MGLIREGQNRVKEGESYFRKKMSGKVETTNTKG